MVRFFLILTLTTNVLAQVEYCGVDVTPSAKVTLRNDISRSQEFDNAFYSKFNSTITADAGVAPDGTTTADRYAETATSTSHAIYNASLITGLTNGVNYRFGVYVKQDSALSWLRLAPSFVGVLNAWYNISSCSVGTVDAGVRARTIKLPNNWCYIEAIRLSDSTSAYWQLYSQESDGQTAAFLGSVSRTVLIWGSILNPESSPADYLETTSSGSTQANVCGQGTSSSIVDPTKCFRISDNRARRW